MNITTQSSSTNPSSSTIFNINNNAFSTTLNNRTRYNSMKEIEDVNYFQYEPNDIFNEVIAKNDEINIWIKEYLLFLERNIDAPKKTVINSEWEYKSKINKILIAYNLILKRVNFKKD